ncbi:hypothetical protein Dhaf_2422 [Desulfitobacterium hafniense DCB-2]|uniref:Large polyvalent protein associated domain-containing protein n=1 Tax=Desulfitobacterium hafniense (strain DSM 10664 / DCB-2) TaxID=272564 RepID=B8FU36_DESHD|nr:LPD28 domain-containing protein [Desulfitobacterium hafniense]ACL20450.1 hypothetical protein Dhaf_2422 [Desulfitobacterium hafniense DCB-2]
MSVNAREDEMQYVEIFERPALFTNWLIDRGTVPPGWYCYDLSSSARNPGIPVRLQDSASANHAGTILSPTALKKPDTAFRRMDSKLNFFGECMTLSKFCDVHGLDFPADHRKYAPRPASPEEAGIFYALTPEQDAELGAIGHVRMDFGASGNEFWSTWWPRGDESLNSPEFKAELTELVNELRETGPLKDLSAMHSYCAGHRGEIGGGWRQNYGYIIETERYRYCLRCSPGQGDYHAYLTAFDLRVQEMNMGEQPEQGSQMGGMQLG